MKEDRMEMIIVGFIVGVAVCYMLMRFDNNVGLKTLENRIATQAVTISNLQFAVKNLDSQMSSNILTIGNNNLKVNEFVSKFESMCSSIEKSLEINDNEIQNIQVFCSKMKQTQIDMQDILSKKRPVIKVPDNINVTLTTETAPKVQKKTTGLGKGVDALIKK